MTLIEWTLRVQRHLNKIAKLRKKVTEAKFKAGKNAGRLLFRSSMLNRSYKSL